MAGRSYTSDRHLPTVVDRIESTTQRRHAPLELHHLRRRHIGLSDPPPICIMRDGSVRVGDVRFAGPSADVIAAFAGRLGVAISVGELALLIGEAPEDVADNMLHLAAQLQFTHYRITPAGPRWYRMGRQ